MFGYLVANLEDASDQEKARYRAAYCGLCRTLGRPLRAAVPPRAHLRHGVFGAAARIARTSPKKPRTQARCLAAPAARRTTSCETRFTGYAADLTVAPWPTTSAGTTGSDDRNVAARDGAGGAWRSRTASVRERLPRQCAAIERRACRHRPRWSRRTRPRPTRPPAASAGCMGELFVIEQDPVVGNAAEHGLRHLGRFVYLMDAACDLERDRQRGSYNPLAALDIEPADQEMALAVIMGQATAAFEAPAGARPAPVAQRAVLGSVAEVQRAVQEGRRTGRGGRNFGRRQGGRRWSARWQAGPGRRSGRRGFGNRLGRRQGGRRGAAACKQASSGGWRRAAARQQAGPGGWHARAGARNRGGT